MYQPTWPIFQQDHARPHSANITMEDVDMLGWPAYTPDYLLTYTIMCHINL